MKISKSRLKIFFCSMMSTLLLIFLSIGFIIVEKNTRLVAFGDSNPFLVYKHENFRISYAKVHFMGKDYIIFKNK